MGLWLTWPSGWHPLPWQGDWNQVIFKVPFSTTYSMTLCCAKFAHGEFASDELNRRLKYSLTLEVNEFFFPQKTLYPTSGVAQGVWLCPTEKFQRGGVHSFSVLPLASSPGSVWQLLLQINNPLASKRTCLIAKHRIFWAFLENNRVKCLPVIDNHPSSWVSHCAALQKVFGCFSHRWRAKD